MDGFSVPTRAWFEGAFASATPAQLGAWQAIGEGRHALVVAPTGSGKTLAAFLAALDSFVQRPSGGATRVLYISPLKALGVDVERNLKVPLEGIAAAALELGVQFAQPSVGLRSGDTTPAERRRLVATPPDILITTPESLYLMLTSRAAATLASVQTVIVDEVHAVAGSKRGAHLALSLERLDGILAHPAQRIGLSATVEPHIEVARFLGGVRPATVVAPPSQKVWDLSVRVPVEDMAALPEDDERNGSMWPHIERQIYDLVRGARSTIVFANSRRTAERLTSRLNELAEGVAAVPTAQPAMMPGQSGMSYGAETGLARAHHGSVSKEHRAQIEADLKSGALRCVVATSSLELGIDMGLVDQVVQVEAPFSVASALQRVGRAGHQVGAASVGIFFPAHRGDLIATAITVRRMREGAIEALAVPSNPLDVLAQQTVAACALGSIGVEEWWERVRRAAPFAALPRAAFEATLDLLAGKYPSNDFAELRPRVVWDREAGTLTGRPGAQRLAVTSGGTIPDRGLYGVFVIGTEESTRGGRRVGELDEEMVYESRVGDVISLGATSWRIEQITHDRVLVRPAFGHPGRLPFWHGDGLGRPAELGRELGAFQASLAEGEDVPHAPTHSEPDAGGVDTSRTGALESWGAAERDAHGAGGAASSVESRIPSTRAVDGGAVRAARARPRDAGGTESGVSDVLEAIGLDANARANAVKYVREQRDATGTVPSDRELVVEQFIDEIGEWRIILHSPYGMAVHAPWALAVAARLRERSGLDCSAVAADDGIVLRLPVGDADPPGAELFVFEPGELEEIVRREVSGSALFAARFRECAARALLLPNRRPGERAPLWQQRLRARSLLEVAQRYPEFPIVLEAARECLQDVYDLPALSALTREIGARQVRLSQVRTEVPSPFARQLLFGYVGQFIYDLDAPLAERRAAMLLDPGLLAELLGGGKLREILDAEIIARTERELQRLEPERKLRGIEGVADLLRLLGPLDSSELAARLNSVDPTSSSCAQSLDPVHAGLGTESTGRTASSGAHRASSSGADPASSSGVDPASSSCAQSQDPAHLAEVREATCLAEELVAARRAMAIQLAGRSVYAAIEDSARLRDALGVTLPTGIPQAFLIPVEDPAADLVGRFAATHGPFVTAAAAQRLGMSVPRTERALQRLERLGRVVAGEFTPGGSARQWCDSRVLETLRRRSLAALRAQIRPVPPAVLARFTARWQEVGGSLTGPDGVAVVLEQLAGVAAPASAWESFILPARVRDFAPGMLDQVLAEGEIVWSGARSLGEADGWIAFHSALDTAATLLRDQDFVPTEPQRVILEQLAAGARFSREIEASEPTRLQDDLWDLVWAGLITNDTFGPVRALAAGQSSAHKPRPTARPRTSRVGRLRGRTLSSEARIIVDRMNRQIEPDPGRSWGSEARGTSALPGGRWSLLPDSPMDSTALALARVEYLLDRYGVVTKGIAEVEQFPGGFGAAYRVLGRMEERGLVRRGMFIEGAGASQFALPGAVDELRAPAQAGAVVVLAATDPANPYGAALPWPATSGTHRPGRKAGAVVVHQDGDPVLYLERGGKTALTFAEIRDADAVARALVVALRRARIPRLSIEQLDGASILGTPLARALLDAGFYSSPKALRFRA